MTTAVGHHFSGAVQGSSLDVSIGSSCHKQHLGKKECKVNSVKKSHTSKNAKNAKNAGARKKPPVGRLNFLETIYRGCSFEEYLVTHQNYSKKTTVT